MLIHLFLIRLFLARHENLPYLATNHTSLFSHTTSSTQKISSPLLPLLKPQSPPPLYAPPNSLPVRWQPRHISQRLPLLPRDIIPIISAPRLTKQSLLSILIHMRSIVLFRLVSRVEDLQMVVMHVRQQNEDPLALKLGTEGAGREGGEGLRSVVEEEVGEGVGGLCVFRAQ